MLAPKSLVLKPLVLESLVVLRDECLLFAPLDMSLAQGGLYQVLGPNGRGKTTLLRTLAGIYGQYRGVFHWSSDQIPVYLGHKAGLHPGLTLLENVKQLFGVYDLDLKPVDQILLALGLMGYEDATTARLSAGQTRKIALTPLLHPAMAQRSWLLDEPFTSLDRQTCELMEQLIKQHVEADGLVLFTSHQSMVSHSLQEIVQNIELQASNEALEGL